MAISRGCRPKRPRRARPDRQHGEEDRNPEVPSCRYMKRQHRYSDAGQRREHGDERRGGAPGAHPSVRPSSGLQLSWPALRVAVECKRGHRVLRRPTVPPDQRHGTNECGCRACRSTPLPSRAASAAILCGRAGVAVVTDSTSSLTAELADRRDHGDCAAGRDRRRQPSGVRGRRRACCCGAARGAAGDHVAAGPGGVQGGVRTPGRFRLRGDRLGAPQRHGERNGTGCRDRSQFGASAGDSCRQPNHGDGDRFAAILVPTRRDRVARRQRPRLCPARASVGDLFLGG